MKLFDNFDAVRFPEENLIFITNGGYLYYIYNPKSNHWQKHCNAGNDYITVLNYPSVSTNELVRAVGKRPTKETDFMRLCPPRQLCTRDMLALLAEDYPVIMEDCDMVFTVQHFLNSSDIRHKSYLKLRSLFDEIYTLQPDHAQILQRVKAFCFEVIGRDIFKNEIGIVDGHDSSSYFWIMPVRVIDDSNTDDIDNVAEMRSAEISIEEDDVDQYLTPFLYKYFDGNLDANKKRVDYYWIDENGEEQAEIRSNFEWYLTYNFFTYDAIENILNDIRDTIDALSTGRETEYTAKLREKRGLETSKLLYARDLSESQIEEYNANRPTENNTAIDLIIDFYQRFLYRIEHMVRVGKEKGYDLISFMGP